MLEGFLTTTEAYNLIKGYLNIPKKSFVNKKFFTLFFKKTEDGCYPKLPPEKIKEIFSKNNISELNKEYYLKKKNGKDVTEIKRKIFEKVNTAMSLDKQIYKGIYFVY